MGALERYDRWAACLDTPTGAADPADAVEDDDPTQTVDLPDLEDVYDAHTLAAIDRRHGEPVARRRDGRAGMGVAAVVAGSAALAVARGMRDAVEPDPDDDIAGEYIPAPTPSRPEAVTVILVPGDPAASVAIVRRWLL